MQKTASNPGALAGIHVVDHTTALAGPYCTQLLGDLGADVIKVERPDGGDMSRGWGPPFVGEESAYFLGTNRNKRGLTLDLSTAAGREILHRLIRQSDVLVHNVPRQVTRKKLGLDQATILGLNPKLVWAGISGFGYSGPLAERPGYDIIAQAMSGTMYITGEDTSPPTRFPTPIADLTAGIYTALAIVTALYSRAQTGVGQAIDMALLDAQATWLSNLASNYLAAGERPAKLGNAHPSIVPYQPFPTRDDWIIVAVGSERLWQALVGALDLPRLAEQKEFATNKDRLRNRDVLVRLLSETFMQRGSSEWLVLLNDANIPCGPILRPESSLSQEQMLARGMVVELQHPALGALKMLGNPINLSATPVSYRRPAPLLGEHNDEIIRELGYSKEQVDKLRHDRII